MIHFDPPFGPAVPANALGKLQTIDDIQTAYAGAFPKPLPAALLMLNVDIHRAAGILYSDAKAGMLPSACLWICRSLLTVGASGMLTGAPRLKSLPTHTKRLMSELSSTALSLAAAEELGIDFFCTVLEFDVVFGQVGKHWIGDGPDYVIWDTNSGSISFLECKGISGSPTPTPPEFAKKKAQSLNAIAPVAPNFAVQAHVLSISYLAAGTECRVRWFNHRRVIDVNPRDKVAGLAIALQHFVRQLKNAGFEDLAQAFKTAADHDQWPNDRAWAVVEERVHVHFSAARTGWRQRENADVLVNVHKGRFGFFFSAARALSVSDFKLAQRLAGRLIRYASIVRARRAGDVERPGANVIYRSMTGVFLTSRGGALPSS